MLHLFILIFLKLSFLLSPFSRGYAIGRATGLLVAVLAVGIYFIRRMKK